jgi:CheY-like chemotaxis protein
MPDLESRRILVVDDDRLFREVLAESLRGEGYEVASAADGTMALSKFGSGAFGVLVVDLEMPGVSGTELAGMVKSMAAGTVVVGMTSEPVSADVAALVRSGCEGLLSKSTLDVSSVLAAVDAGLDRQRAHQLAATHQVVEMARREVATGLLPAMELLVGELEALSSGEPAAKSPAQLKARSLAAARQIREVLRNIQTDGQSPGEEA